MGLVRVNTREDRDKLHDYLSTKVGGGRGGIAVSSGGSPPDCWVRDSRMSDGELRQFAKSAGVTVQAHDRSLASTAPWTRCWIRPAQGGRRGTLESLGKILFRSTSN